MGSTAGLNRTIIGPLTTTFTPAPSCTVAAAACANGCSNGYWAQTCSDDILSDATSCWPPASANAPSPTPPFYGWGFYSPGLICPVGYSSACSATGTAQQDAWQYQLEAEETAVGCCPRCDLGFPQTCVSSAGSQATFPVITCSSSSFEGYTFLTLPLATSYTTSSSSGASETIVDYVLNNYEIRAPMFEIRWQSTDRPATSTPMTALTTTPGTTSATANIQPTSQSSSGLSEGAKIAIGVCIPIAVIAALIAAGFFLLNKKRKRSAANLNARTEYRHELPDSKLANSEYHGATETESTPLYEMESYMGPAELDSHEAQQPFSRKSQSSLRR